MSKRFNMSRVRNLVGFVAILLLVVAVTWYQTSPRRANAGAIVRCREAYSRASSLADSARVDELMPSDWSKGNSNPIRCGGLRAAGLL